MADGKTELDQADLPPGLSPEAVALIVRGDAMNPVYDDGDLLYYDDVRRGSAISDLVGLRCVVKISNGPILVKKLGKGSSRSTFTLWSHDAEPRVDEKVDWAAFIEWHRPAKARRG